MSEEKDKEGKRLDQSTGVLLISGIGVILFLFTWAAGVVMAKGFWMTVQAICNPFYGIYKVTEKILSLMGWV